MHSPPKSSVARWTWRIAQRGEVIADRLRSAWWRFVRGASVSAKCRIGARVRFDRPWNVALGERVTLEPDVWCKLATDAARVQIGDYTFVGRGAEIDVTQRVVIGRHVLIAPGVFITDHNHDFSDSGLIQEQGCTARPVTIEDDVWLGTRCVILPGVTIGRGAVVGAGAVVVHDVAEDTVVAGVPARFLRHRADRETPVLV